MVSQRLQIKSKKNAVYGNNWELFGNFSNCFHLFTITFTFTVLVFIFEILSLINLQLNFD